MHEILEHTADIGFRAFGESLPELFANSALALLSIAGEPAAVDPERQYPLFVSGAIGLESLMVDWLNEVLFWFDGRGIAFHEFRVIRIDDSSLEAAGLGQPRGSRHRASRIVKAVTYHQLRVEQRDGRWVAEVYVDV